jgi:hypothetical protein
MNLLRVAWVLIYQFLWGCLKALWRSQSWAKRDKFLDDARILALLRIYLMAVGEIFQ